MTHDDRHDLHDRHDAFGALTTRGARGTHEASRAAAPSSTHAGPEGLLAFEPAVELARRIRAKEIGSLELTRLHVHRVGRFDATLNAVVVRDFERALEAANAADAVLARGEPIGPLHGVPVTLKESFDVAGLATTWGVPAFVGNVAASDSDVAVRLRAAGAIVLGKTNVPLMLSDFQTSNEVFGTTNNPWDSTRGPGGSSGGAAAALAAGLTALDVGSDLGGSVRNPAHSCGVFGHKPTYGLVSMRGHGLPAGASGPRSPDMAVCGPLARSAADLAVALEVLAGPSTSEDAPGLRLELPPPRRTCLRGLRVAVWPTDAIAPVDDEVAERVQRVADLVARRGAVVSDRARPAFDPSAYRATYAALVAALTGAAASDAAYHALKERARALDPGDDSKAAAFARSLVLDHRAWLRHDEERAELRRAWRSFFEAWDVLLCPVMATTAVPHDARPPMARTVTVNGAEQPWFDQVFWASLASLAYLPATVFPFGASRSGLPIGVQVIGAEYADRTTLEVARLITEEEGASVAPPWFGEPG